MQKNNQFVAGIVHDLRGPISCINLFLETFELQVPMDSLPAQIKNMVKSCQRCSQQVVMMVSNVLDYSKMQEGMLEILFQEENVNDLVKDAVDLHL